MNTFMTWLKLVPLLKWWGGVMTSMEARSIGGRVIEGWPYKQGVSILDYRIPKDTLPLITPLIPQIASKVFLTFMIQKLFAINFEGILNDFQIPFHCNVFKVIKQYFKINVYFFRLVVCD